MIQLGYTTDARYYQGSSTYLPYQSDDKNFTADEALANQQLQDIAAYLKHVSWLLGGMNGSFYAGLSDHKYIEAYAKSESSALRITKKSASPSDPDSKSRPLGLPDCPFFHSIDKCFF